MTKNHEDILNYIESWDIENNSLTVRENLIEFMNGLYNFFRNTSTIPNSHTNEVAKTDYFSTNKGIITYCGKINDISIFNILKALYEKNTGYYIMSQTEMGEILNFGGKKGLYSSFRNLLRKDPSFPNSSIRDFIQYNILGDIPKNQNRSKYVKDINGNEIEGLLTIFDYCSEKIVDANASGNALFIGNETSGTDNVFVLTELPTLLNSSKVTMIDGIETSLFLSNRFSDRETDLVEIFNCLIGVCNKAFSGITENIVSNNSNYQDGYMFIITQLSAFISKLLN